MGNYLFLQYSQPLTVVAAKPVTSSPGEITRFHIIGQLWQVYWEYCLKRFCLQQTFPVNRQVVNNARHVISVTTTRRKAAADIM